MRKLPDGEIAARPYRAQHLGQVIGRIAGRYGDIGIADADPEGCGGILRGNGRALFTAGSHRVGSTTSKNA